MMQDVFKDFSMDGSLIGMSDTNQKNETENLRSKLEAATEICAQQEKHFTRLVKDLEQKLSEAVSGRDELLALRQKESVTQQQLIFQLQATLQQTNQTLELRNEELSNLNVGAKINEEKLSQSETALVKIHSVLKDEEIKRGSTNILTGVTPDNQNFYNGDLLIQVLSMFLQDDDAKISDLILKNQEVETQLKELKDLAEDKVELSCEYEKKLINLEADHAKSLDIAANRTLTERNRNTELLREINENRIKYEKTISEHERMITSMEENIKACRVELSEKDKQLEIQHGNNVALQEEMQNKLENHRKEKEEILTNVLRMTTSETNYEEKITSLENKVKVLTLKLESTEKRYKDSEKELQDNMSQLQETLKEKEDAIKFMKRDHEQELRQKTDQISSLEKDESSELELRKKTDEVLKFMEECRTLRYRIDLIENEKSLLLKEKEVFITECENRNKKISNLQEEKSNLSVIVRENVDDLTRAKSVINSLQVKLDQREKSLEVFNKQEADLAALLFQKQLAGESLLQERQQIVEFLEAKVRENDELKRIRDALAEKLELRVQVLSEMESTCRALETKLEVRNNELEVIMDDRNKAVREVENKVVELTKLKEERDSLVTLMNGKQSEKDQEITKLIFRLKGSQHDLALTKKVLDAKKEASEKAIRMASVAQEEITTKRKEIDGLKDRIKWLQDSLQATAKEKVLFESKASELAIELQDKIRENENISAELDQMMKYYDNANGQVNQMEMALEKAGIKFAESQALVERLEQDLAKIKLQYSLEVKELEMKVKSVEGRGQYVQVVKPFRFQEDVPGPRYRENVVATTKQLSATQQRLTDEADMTEGFKILLKDLHELMSNIKDSSIMLRRENNVMEKKAPTVVDVVQDKTEQKKTTTKTLSKTSKRNESSISLDGRIIEDSETTVASDDTLPKPCSEPGKNQGKEAKKKSRRSKAEKVSAPLHSSSPKSTSPVFDSNVENEFTSECGDLFSDISDFDSDHSECRRERTAKRMKQSSKSPKSRNPKPLQKSSKLKERIDSYVESEDVDSLLMPQELPRRSHRRAKKILDLLALKGQELTNGNQKIADLICRQGDGIKRCREVEKTTKRFLK